MNGVMLYKKNNKEDSIIHFIKILKNHICSFCFYSYAKNF